MRGAPIPWTMPGIESPPRHDTMPSSQAATHAASHDRALDALTLRVVEGLRGLPLCAQMSIVRGALESARREPAPVVTWAEALFDASPDGPGL